MGRWLGKILTTGIAPPQGWFAAVSGSPAAAGTFSDPWDIITALYGGPGYTYAGGNVTIPGTSVQPGDTIWLRGGTYKGPYDATAKTTFGFQLDGTAANPITIRGFPGERVILDDNYDPAVVGHVGSGLFDLRNYFSTRGYLILRDVEITNSNPHRLGIPDLSLSRDDGVQVTSRHSKVINCILHDSGQGGFLSSAGAGWEVYGNLVYYNGFYAPFAEQNEAVAVDLVPSGGTPVATSGTYHAQQTGATSITISSHINPGDYTLVAVGKNGLDYTTITATFDGTSMTLLDGEDGYSKSVAMFGLAGHTTTANVTVQSNDSSVVRAIAQSFVNVGSIGAGGKWYNNQWADSRDGASPGTVSGTPATHYDNGTTTTTDTDHLVVDGIAIYCAYSENVAPSGDNTGNMIGGATPASFGSNPIVRMSTATRTGAGTVNMHWGWDMLIFSHGHGYYVQAGASDNVVTTATNTTIVWSGYTGSNESAGPWRNYDIGGTIRILGAGIAGADLVTTINSNPGNSHIVVQDAPSASITAEASWGSPCTLKHNVVLDEGFYGSQFYGSSGAACVNIDAVENFWFYSGLILGGLTGFRLTDTVFHDNYTWQLGTNIGDQINHLRNLRVENNYMVGTTGIYSNPAGWDDLSVTGNTFIGTTANIQPTFPTNTFLTSDPVVNKIVVLPNDYETNRCNILVYNWEGLATVDVDISSAVAVGTPINVMNAQDYFSTPVLTTTYGGGTINLPMTGLTVAAAIGGAGGDAGAEFVPQASYGPAFAAFIVRAQSTETWR